MNYMFHAQYLPTVYVRPNRARRRATQSHRNRKVRVMFRVQLAALEGARR